MFILSLLAIIPASYATDIGILKETPPIYAVQTPLPYSLDAL